MGYAALCFGERVFLCSGQTQCEKSACRLPEHHKSYGSRIRRWISIKSPYTRFNSCGSSRKINFQFEMRNCRVETEKALINLNFVFSALSISLLSTFRVNIRFHLEISFKLPGTSLHLQLHYFPMKPCSINNVGVSFSLRHRFFLSNGMDSNLRAGEQRALLVDEIVLLQLKLLNDGAENEQRGRRPWLFPSPSSLFECFLSYSSALSTIENKEKSEQKAESFISCQGGLS